MISFYPVKLADAMREWDFTEIFESVCISEGGAANVALYLNNIPLVKIIDEGGQFLGMLSVEPYGAFGVEVHAFVLPNKRNRSKSVLETFKEALFTLTPFTTIRTSVTSDFKPLVRFLSFIGFEVVGERLIEKQGETCKMFYLETHKGD